MRLKLYIVTYKNNIELDNTLQSLDNSDIHSFNYEVKVVNNSVDVPIVIRHLPLEYSIISNETRPTFSTGHLARNWNECLIDGFKDVSNPDCGIVVLLQNDVRFMPNTFSQLVGLHKQYSFIQSGAGDALHSYTIDTIKKVGLWDERFCNIGFQEADYFLRQRLYNSNGCTINDNRHNRLHNSIGEVLTIPIPTGWDRSDTHHLTSAKYHKLSLDMFNYKWNNGNYQDWVNNTENLVSPQFILYPYFEDKFAIGNPNYHDYSKS